MVSVGLDPSFGNGSRLERMNQNHLRVYCSIVSYGKIQFRDASTTSLLESCLAKYFANAASVSASVALPGYLSVAILLYHTGLSLSQINSDIFLHAAPPLALGDSSQSQPLIIIIGPYRPYHPNLRGAAFHLIRLSFCFVGRTDIEARNGAKGG